MSEQLPCTQCGYPNDNGDSNVCRGCLISRNFPPAPTSERTKPVSKHLNAIWILPDYQEKWGSTLFDVWEIGQSRRLDTYTFLKDARKDYPTAEFIPNRESLLRLCHGAPKAVGMDTTDLETAIRKLVDFAWGIV